MGVRVADLGASLINQTTSKNHRQSKVKRYDVIDGMLTNHAMLPVPHLGVSEGIRGYQGVRENDTRMSLCVQPQSPHKHMTSPSPSGMIPELGVVQSDIEAARSNTSPEYQGSVDTDTYSYSSCYFMCFGLISV